MDDDAFAEHAAACRREGGALPEHIDELRLAWRAARGDTQAVRHIDDEYLSRIDAVVRGIDGVPAFLDEVRQTMRVELFVAGERTSPRIASFQGRGPLLAWIRVAALRVALQMKRGRKPIASSDDLLAELVAREPDPERQHMETLYRAEFAQSLREAIAALPERERVILRLHYVEGLRLARIGELYGVHESTVSRWLKKAADDVADGAQQRLRDRLAISQASFDSLARLVKSGLDVSISRLLAGGS